MRTLALLIAFAAFPAFSAESLEKTTVTFRNGETYDFVPFDLLANGTSVFHVKQQGAAVTVEEFDGQSLSADSDTLGCFEIFYDAKTDLVQCTQRNGYQGWYTNYYRGAAGLLKLVKVTQLDLDDPETDQNEEKTLTLYEAK